MVNKSHFIFYFASQAYYDEGRNAFPIEGITSYGDMVHEFNIPVTWLTNTEGAKRGKEVFENYHKEYGDEVILWAMPSMKKSSTNYKRDYVLSMSEEQILKYLKKEQEGIKEILPWAKVDHIGFFYRTLPAVKAMQKLGVKSCYGHCWEMPDTDGVTDIGVPWGFYYLDPELSWKRPQQNPEGPFIVANEWLQHDLNKCWNYFGSTSIFTYDPNDVERAKICTANDIEYWKEAFREYYKNRLWNDCIVFVFHQEAHEQESRPDGFHVYPPETIQVTHEMTKKFLEFITSGEFPDMEIMTLPQAVEFYRSTFAQTAPTYMHFRDIMIKNPEWNKLKEEVWNLYCEIKKEEEEDGESLDPVKDYKKFKFLNLPYGWQGMVYKDREPFPDSIVYVDYDMQLFFHKDNPLPVKAYNYLKVNTKDPRELFFREDLFVLKEHPEITITPLNDSSNGKEEGWKVSISSNVNIPYGIVLWENLESSSLSFTFSEEKQRKTFRWKQLGPHALVLSFHTGNQPWSFIVKQSKI